MSSAAESFFKALLPLSGNPAFAEARKALLGSIKDEDLEQLVKHGISREFSRSGSEAIALTILDVAAAEARVPEAGKTVIKSEEEQDPDVQIISSGM
jgi:hypothetical protein